MASNIFKKKFYLWWLSVLLIATSFFWASYMGFVTKIWHTDITMLSSVAVLGFVFANIKLGWVTYHIDSQTASKALLNKETNTVWFLSEILMAIGMLGTVIGLIHMLSGVSLSGAAQQDALQGILGNLWKDMGMALYTNAVGLVGSIVLKLQAHFIIGDEVESDEGE